MKTGIKESIDWWDGAPSALENPAFRKAFITPALRGFDGVKNTAASAFENFPGAHSPFARFLGAMAMDIGIISSASIFFTAWSFGIVPLTIAAGLGFASVAGLKVYNTLFISAEQQNPAFLNQKSKIERFFKRPGGSYTLSSLVSFGTCLGLVAAAATGGIPALGASALVTAKFLSMTSFGLLFAAANNIKAAKLDHDLGYDVKPFYGLRKLDASWSERMSIWGNLARNFVTGPVIGLLSLPLMREALKFTRRYKENELHGGQSFTDKHLSRHFNWTKPKSDSGMARTLTGLASTFTAVAAAGMGDFKLSFALAYPAFAQYVLGEKSHDAYAVRLKREFHEIAHSDGFPVSKTELGKALHEVVKMPVKATERKIPRLVSQDLCSLHYAAA